MTVREVIEALQAIEQEHGPNVPVCHHDDWDFFLVQSVTYEEKYDEGGSVWPEHVAIDCDHYRTRISQLPGGYEEGER